jgi:hypothetical protein
MTLEALMRLTIFSGREQRRQSSTGRKQFESRRDG